MSSADANARNWITNCALAGLLGVFFLAQLFIVGGFAYLQAKGILPLISYNLFETFYLPHLVAWFFLSSPVLKRYGKFSWFAAVLVCIPFSLFTVLSTSTPRESISWIAQVLAAPVSALLVLALTKWLLGRGEQSARPS